MPWKGAHHPTPCSTSPARQHLGNLGPAVAQHFVGLADDAVLLLRPAGLLHLGVEVVVPALPALLPQPALQVLGDERPLLRAILLNQLNDLERAAVKKSAEPGPAASANPAPSTTVAYLLVFLFGPWPLDQVWIQDPQPPILALLVSAVLQGKKASWGARLRDKAGVGGNLTGFLFFSHPTHHHTQG